MTSANPPTYDFNGLNYNPDFFTATASNINSALYMTTTTAQTITGQKTFNALQIFNGGIDVNSTPVTFPAGSIDAAAINGLSTNYVDKSSDQTIGGIKTFTSVPICSTNATTDYQLTNKSYVDTAVSNSLSGTFTGTINTANTITTTTQIYGLGGNFGSTTTNTYVEINGSLVDFHSGGNTDFDTRIASSGGSSGTSGQGTLTLSGATIILDGSVNTNNKNFSTGTGTITGVLATGTTVSTSPTYPDSTTKVASTAFVSSNFVDKTTTQSVGGFKTFTSGLTSLSVNAGDYTNNAYVEQTGGGTESHIDMHSGGNTDFDVRLQCGGGSAGASGQGSLTVTAAGGISLNGATTINSGLTVTTGAGFGSTTYVNPSISVTGLKSGGGTGTGEIGIANGTGSFSTSAVAGDTIIRSQNNNLLLQSGNGGCAIKINTSNNVTFTGATYALSSNVGDYSSNNSYLEMGGGGSGAGALSLIDFHSGYNADFDCRIIATGGNAGSAGQGTLSISAATTNISGTLNATLSTSGTQQFGKIGIGIAAGVYNLQVASQTNTEAGAMTYFTNTSSPSLTYQASLPTNYIGNFCAKFGSGIYCGSTIATFSDARIKNVLQTNFDDLSLIEQINPVRYTYKDNLKGTNVHIGFIAQDVKKIIPDIVHYDKEVIPDVMSIAENVNDSIYKLVNHNLVENDIIDIFDENNVKFTVNIVKVLSPDEFEIDDNVKRDKIFVYGKITDDFHTLDYNSVFTLGFAGVKKLIQKNRELEDKVAKMSSFLQSKFPDFIL